jgi:hypothetical protein
MLQLTQDSRHLMQGILTSGSTWEIWIKNPSTHQYIIHWKPKCYDSVLDETQLSCQGLGFRRVN